MKTSHAVTLLAIFLIATASIYLIANRGYGKVSRESYDMATAIYGACLAKSEPRVEKVEQLILASDGSANDPMTKQERQWLIGIIQKAKNGNWDSAANSARRIMEDQIER